MTILALMFTAAGNRVFSTSTTAQNPPIFADFNCGANANNLSDCSNPSGLTSRIIYSCTSGVVGVQCARKYSVCVYCSDNVLKMNPIIIFQHFVKTEIFV